VTEPIPPQAFQDFSARFPELAQAWETAGTAGRDGPLDDRAAALIKLGIAVGARLEGPVHAAVRKAAAKGISREEMEQVIALSATTIGFPGCVAGWTWMRDELDKA